MIDEAKTTGIQVLAPTNDKEYAELKSLVNHISNAIEMSNDVKLVKVLQNALADESWNFIIHELENKHNH